MYEDLKNTNPPSEYETIESSQDNASIHDAATVNSSHHSPKNPTDSEDLYEVPPSPTEDLAYDEVQQLACKMLPPSLPSPPIGAEGREESYEYIMVTMPDVRAPVPPPRLRSISHGARLGLPDLQHQSSADTFPTTDHTITSTSNAQNLYDEVQELSKPESKMLPPSLPSPPIDAEEYYEYMDYDFTMPIN